jgi:hypothetical protein
MSNRYKVNYSLSSGTNAYSTFYIKDNLTKDEATKEVKRLKETYGIEAWITH